MMTIPTLCSFDENPRLKRKCSKHAYYLTALILGLLVAFTCPARAAVRTKADNTTVLNLAGSWVESAVPASADNIVIDTTLSTARTANLGGTISCAGIQVTTARGVLTIGATTGAFLTNGAGGIDMTAAAQDLNISCVLALGAVNTWDIASGRTLTVSGAITNLGNLLTIQGAGTATITSTNWGTGGLAKNGTGTLNLNRASQFTGPVTISGGNVIATGGGGFGGVFGLAGAVTITNATVNNSTGNNGPFGNPGGAATEGTPANLKSGNVTLQTGGLLTMGSGITAHIPRILVFSGGELGSSGTVLATFGTWNIEQGAIVTNTTATSTISAQGVILNQQGGTVFDVASVAVNGIDLDVPGYFGHGSSVSDNGLIKKGAGLMRLQGTNTYTGNTIVSNGVLRLSGFGSISNSPQIAVSAGAKFDVSGLNSTFTLGSSRLLTGSGVVTGNVVVASGGRLSPGSGAGTLSFSNNLTLNGTTTNIFELSNNPIAGVNDRVAIAGNLNLLGVNTIAVSYTSLGSGRYPLFTYAGTLTGDTNNLVLTGFTASGRQTAYLDTSVPNEIALVVGGAGASLSWVGDNALNNWDTNTTSNWFNLGSASADYFFDGDPVAFGDTGSKTPAVNLSGTVQPATILVTNNTGTFGFGGTGKISGNTGLTKRGAGMLVITNTGGNDFSGKTSVTGGTVSINADSGLGAAPGVSVSDQLSLDGGALQTLATFSLGATRGLTLGNGGGIVDTASGTLTYGGAISGAGNLTKIGSGTFVVSLANNPYTGKTIINGGTVSVNGISRLGATPADVVLDQITIENGAQLLYTAAAVSTSPVQRGFRIGSGGGTMACNTSGTLAIEGPLTGTGNLTNAGNSGSVGTIELDNATNSLSGDVYTTSGFFRLDDDGQFGTGTLHWYGGGLTANNDRGTTANYIANPIDMAADFLLRANSGNNISPRNIIFSSGAITATAGTLTVNNVTAISNHIFAACFHGAGFTFPRPIVLTCATSNFTYLTFGNSNGTVQTFSGVISGSGRMRRTAVVPTDAGKTFLTAANTYSGSTEIDAGTLLVNNLSGSGTGSGNVIVTNAGILGGSGALSGTVTINGTIAPGASLGVLATGPQIWNAGGAYSWELVDAAGTAGSGWDLLNITGGIDLEATSGNPFKIKLISLAGSGVAGSVTNFDNNTSYNWNIATLSGTVTNFDASKFTIDTGAFSNDLAGGSFVIDSVAMNLRFTNNHAPITALHTVTRGPGTSVKIRISELKVARWSDADGDDTVLFALDANSTNGLANLTQSGDYIYYMPGTNGNVTDRFNYAIRDVRASYRAGDTVRTATGTIEVQVADSSSAYTITSLQLNQPGIGTNTLTLAGIPGYQYVVQFSTNMADWENLSTNTADGSGRWTVIDDTATNDMRFYRSIAR